jgi:hypothetical protein
MLFSTAGLMWHEILNDDHKGKDVDEDTPISKHCTRILEKRLQKCVIYNKILGNQVKNCAGYIPNIQPIFFFIVVPCILITSKFFSPTNAPFY